MKHCGKASENPEKTDRRLAFNPSVYYREAAQTSSGTEKLICSAQLTDRLYPAPYSQ
jgi:hypothetical protein